MMGSWVIHIEGTGAHHNGRPSVDANEVMEDAILRLLKQGQSIETATFTSSGRDDVLLMVAKRLAGECAT